MKNQKGIVNGVIGVLAGTAVGIAINSVMKDATGMTVTMLNAAKLVGGTYLAATRKSNAMYLAGGLALAAEGASELIAQYTGGSADTYQGPSLFGFPGVYTSPGYYAPYRLNGVGMLGDAGVTEQMRY